ncbi:hypothetical protein BDV93DRAFT_511505 [Ceratobasidium sp. AG-I]|nr:hypothetical protein BDV93DRAFT_511505 [Ceratobasidium sp. AG-I]
MSERYHLRPKERQGEINWLQELEKWSQRSQNRYRWQNAQGGGMWEARFIHDFSIWTMRVQHFQSEERWWKCLEDISVGKPITIMGNVVMCIDGQSLYAERLLHPARLWSSYDAETYLIHRRYSIAIGQSPSSRMEASLNRLAPALHERLKDLQVRLEVRTGNPLSFQLAPEQVEPGRAVGLTSNNNADRYSKSATFYTKLATPLRESSSTCRTRSGGRGRFNTKLAQHTTLAIPRAMKQRKTPKMRDLMVEDETRSVPQCFQVLNSIWLKQLENMTARRFYVD